MKKYMAVYVIDGEQNAKFFDKLSDVDEFKMNAECGMGGLVEVYKRHEPTGKNDYRDGYEFMYS